MVQYVKSSRASSPNTKIQDVPNVPTIGTPVQNGSIVEVPFTPASIGGQAAVYRAISNPGGIQGISYGSSPVQVSGLNSFTSYTFTVRGETSTGATNGNSSVSSSIIPVFSAMELISTAYGPTNFVDFTNIPQEYKHLQIRYTARDTGAFTTRGLFLEINGNLVSPNSQHYMLGNGSSVSSSSSTNIGRFDWSSIPAANATSGVFASGSIDILDYSSTSKNKTLRTLHGLSDSSSANNITLWSGMWNSTSAITLMRIYPNNSFATGSRISLYGIRG